MKLIEVAEALDLGCDARDEVHRATTKPSRRLGDLLGAWWAAISGAAPASDEPPAAVAASARDALADYASALERLTVTSDDPVLGEAARSGRAWPGDLWEAHGAARAVTGQRILAELTPSLDRLAEIRASLILRRRDD